MEKVIQSYAAMASRQMLSETIIFINLYKPSVPFVGHRQTVQTLIRRSIKLRENG